MRWLILFVFVGTFLTRDVMLSKVQEYPSNLAWLFGSSKLNDNTKEKRTVCESEECKKMADMILGSMNRSVDPCEDFYEYACGKWPEKNPIPKGLNRWNMLNILQLKTFQEIQKIVEAEPTENDLRAVKLAKKWYKACMDTDAIEKEGIDPLVSTLTYLGGWPMIMESDKWDEQEYSWQKVDDQYMRLTGRNAFYDVRIQKNSDDPKIIEIDTPHLPPGSKKFRSAIESDSEEEDEEEDEEDDEESKSDEDPSDEEEQSNEDHEPGSESEDDSKINDNDDDDDDDADDDDEDDNDVDDDDNDDDDNTDEQDEDVKKKIDKKKIASRIDHRKSKKLRYVGQRKNSTRIIKKHDNHESKRQRIRRWAIAKVDNKRAQRFIRRKKLFAQKGERNHVKKIHRKMTKNFWDNRETMYTTAIPQMSTEEAKKMTILQQMTTMYADYISKVAHVIAKDRGTEISQERLYEDIQDMIKFQLRLIQITPTGSIFDSLFDLEIKLRGFQEWYDKKNPKTAKSKIDWVNKIKALFDEAYESVDDNLNLDIISPSYIESLLSLLDETSNRTIVNYIHWNFISRIIKTTTNEMKDLYESWEKMNKGESPRTRSYICKNSAEIKEILAYEFVRKYFSDDTLKTASNMISDIQKEVENLIKKSDWMDDDAKDFALEKLKNLKKFIGYPNWYKNTTIIQEYFKGLIIGSSYYENTLRYNKYIKLKSLRKLSKNDDKINEKEKLNPVEVNAFYIPWKNALVITAADFQSPSFVYDRPQAVNFGIIGFIMAHEINHGFDDTGHLYDKDGNFLGWFSSMAKAYDKKEDCFVEQFNNYPIDKKTNKKIENYGEQTTSDNIADTMGLQAIFKVFQSKEKESEIPDAALSGMEDFTNDQLFFLSFANLWCEAVDPNKLMNVAKKDEHSIGRLRIIGSVSNSNDFARVYNCPVGSPMNPEKKCNIWK